MIYQSDFSKKQTLSDGSTNFPDFMIRDFGCYFLCLCFLDKGHFSKQYIRDIYYESLENQAIDYDCFVRDSLFLLKRLKILKKFQ